MRHIKQLLILTAFAIIPFSQSHSQEIFVEASATVGDGKFSPLWLMANKNGLVSPFNNSAYERAGINGTVNIDSAKQLKLDYAVDMEVVQNAQSNIFVHEAYAELSWKKFHLQVGQKENHLDFRREGLTSGGMGIGTNAQPLPKAMLNVDYFSFPGTHQWWKIGGRVGYGMTTDGAWQKDWLQDNTRYTTNHLYCERAFMFKVGREEKFPLTFELSLQMMTQFGGTSYNVIGRNHHDAAPIVHPEDFNAFWHAFWPMGSNDVTDGNMSNSAGNTFGSYILSLQYHGNYGAPKDEQWYVNTYFERIYEDQSMLTVQYGIYDHLLGIEVGLKKNPYVSHVLVEHISTTDQSGPVYHDSSPNIPESYCGMDNYYNHNLFPGWQHWGMSMGNALLTSPIYNDNHQLMFLNNRVKAWHLGMDGNPTANISWRAMATFTQNWGSYDFPFLDKKNEQHYLIEASYTPDFIKGWRGTLGFGMDKGEVMGNNTSVQLTIRKTLKF